MKITVSELKRIIKEEVQLAEDMKFKSRLKDTGRTKKVGNLLGKSTALQGAVKGMGSGGTGEISRALKSFIEMIVESNPNLNDSTKILNALKAINKAEIEDILKEIESAGAKR